MRSDASIFSERLRWIFLISRPVATSNSTALRVRHVLANIRENLRNLADQVPDRLESFEHEARQPLTFGNFVRFHDYEPEALLATQHVDTVEG